MRFFFYGTLLDGSDNPVAREVHRLLRSLGPATAPGMLWAIPDPQGWFPALLAGEGTVHGGLYEAREGFGPADLARLDAYEDYFPERPQDSLYVRRLLDATPAGGIPGPAEVYLYNQPLSEGSQAIAGGSFREWLSQHGHAQFTGLRDAT